MLHSILPSLVLLASLYSLQCGASTNEPQSKEAASQKRVGQVDNAESARQTQRAGANAAESRCDFSAYAPISISHFYPKKVAKGVKPKYPPEAVSRGVRGWVMVKALVNRDGDVERACATEGDELLRPAAEAAALEWKFTSNFGFTSKRGEKAKQDTYAQVVLPFHFVVDRDDADVGITVLPSP